MNYANLETSPRLQRVLKYLKRCKTERSTMDIIKAANVCAVNSIMSELRRNGFTIKTRREGGVYFYKLQDE